MSKSGRTRDYDGARFTACVAPALRLAQAGGAFSYLLL